MTCSALLAAQDEAVSVDAADRERIRRVWFLAMVRDRLSLADKLDPGATIFAPLPECAPGMCDFPGCEKRRMKHATLCAAHHRQIGRNGRINLAPLTTATWTHERADSPCPKCWANDWARSSKGRSCRPCGRARAAASYARRRARQVSA